jgi:hypothetical protein
VDSWFFPFCPRPVVSAIEGLEEAKKLAGEILRLIQDRLSDAEFGKNPANVSNQFAASTNRAFQFHKGFGRRACASTIQIVCPLELIVETQPQL